MPFNINRSPKIVFMALLSVAPLLLAASVAGIGAQFFSGHLYVFGLVSWFNFDTEANVPTIYSALAILFAGFCLLYTTRHAVNSH